VVVGAVTQGTKVPIEVVDDRAGVPAELLDRVLEPFFTTKDPGEGTGLGLALVKRIITEHAGSIDLDSHPGSGSTFTLHLPTVEQP